MCEARIMFLVGITTSRSQSQFHSSFDFVERPYITLLKANINIYIYIFFSSGQGFRHEFASSRPQYGILGFGISRSNRFVRAPSSGGGLNSPRLSLSIPNLEVNAHGC